MQARCGDKCRESGSSFVSCQSCTEGLLALTAWEVLLMRLPGFSFLFHWRLVVCCQGDWPCSLLSGTYLIYLGPWPAMR